MSPLYYRGGVFRSPVGCPIVMGNGASGLYHYTGKWGNWDKPLYWEGGGELGYTMMQQNGGTGPYHYTEKWGNWDKALY